MDKKIVEDFNKEYYESDVWNCDRTKFMGVTTYKNPADMWTLQELIFKVKPTLIIETGSAHGGSALYMMVMLDAMARCGLKQGKIISIDIEEKKRPGHPHIQYYSGVSSIDERLVAKVKRGIISKDRVLVVLDSDHTEEHVLREMELYAPLVTLGSYMVVEDTNVTIGDSDKGPGTAVKKFLENPMSDFFTQDLDCEKFGLTFNPGGYLRRIL
jgi:cephalosporin hydroxylase